MQKNGLTPEQVKAMGTLEFNLEIARTMTRERFQHDSAADERDPALEILEHVALSNIDANLRLIFRDERPLAQRIFLSQVVMAFFHWDALSLMVQTPLGEFEERYTPAIAVDALIKQLATVTGQLPGEIVRTLPEPLASEVIYFPLLRDMKRPLAFLEPDFVFPPDPGVLATQYGVPAEMAGRQFDAIVVERRELDASMNAGKLRRRALLLQCVPDRRKARRLEQDQRTDRIIQQLQIGILRFAEAEIWRDPVVVADEVLNYARDAWGWRELEETDGMSEH